MFKEREVSKWEPAIVFVAWFGTFMALQKFGVIPTQGAGVAALVVISFFVFAIVRYYNAVWK
jgi:hypothetical protein